jgi:hypothetical protein
VRDIARIFASNLVGWRALPLHGNLLLPFTASRARYGLLRHVV